MIHVCVSDRVWRFMLLWPSSWIFFLWLCGMGSVPLMAMWYVKCSSHGYGVLGVLRSWLCGMGCVPTMAMWYGMCSWHGYVVWNVFLSWLSFWDVFLSWLCSMGCVPHLDKAVTKIKLLKNETNDVHLWVLIFLFQVQLPFYCVLSHLFLLFPKAIV